MLNKIKLVLTLLFSINAWKWIFRCLEFGYRFNADAIPKLGSLGKGTWIEPTVKITDPQNLFIGERCHINHLSCWQPGIAKITVGDRLRCGPGTMVFASNYDLSESTLIEAPQTADDVIIGDDVWLGAGVIVTAGVTIGDRTVVGAGAVVTKSLPSDAIAVGIPAKPIATRRQNQ